ncbi:MAG: hypothetical protein QOH58_2097 [Thermoleophilaceae bacterium]|jgi:hypothetical protein|nr:hypothetical protein [Thermoleophilaceae bacterium]
MLVPILTRRHSHSDLNPLARGLWAACASVVAVFILLAALEAVDPGEAVELTAVVVALAALLLAHEWRGLFRAESGDGSRGLTPPDPR